MAKGFNDLPTSVQAGILIAVPVLLGVGFFFEGIPTLVDGVWPLKARQEGLHRDYLKLKAENDQNEAYRQQQVEFLNRIRDMQGQLETLRSIVPDQPDTDAFMRSVFDVGASTGINVRTFIPQAQVTQNLFVEMPFGVRLDGTYYSLLSFFEALAKEQRIVSVKNLSLGGPQGGGMGSYTVHPNETVGANCTITTYYNPPTTAPPAPPIKKK